MNAIDPTVRQQLLNHFSAARADIEPLILKEFENDHYDAPSFFGMAVAVAHALMLLKDASDGVIYLKKSAESIEWLVDKIRQMAKMNSEKPSHGLNERERVLATLAKHQVSTRQGLSEKAISAATLLPAETVLVILDQLATTQIVARTQGTWLIQVEDLSG